MKFVKRELLWRKEKNGILVMGDVHICLLNEDGSDLWLFCHTPRRLEEIADHVSNRLRIVDPIEKKKLKIQIRSFLKKLVKLGLIVQVKE